MKRLWVLAVVALLLISPAASAVVLRSVTPHLYPGETVAGGPVAWGPDGNLWFATSRGRVARMTRSGSVTEFGHGITEGGAAGPVVSTGGVLWFVEAQPLDGPLGAQFIGRITTGGVVSEISSGLQQVSNITAGPGGTLWFDGCLVAQGFPCHEIGKITAAGHVRLFALPGDVAPLALTLGGDGQVWFAINSDGRSTNGELGRISSSGAVSIVHLPTGIGAPDDGAPVVRGPGGGIWWLAPTRNGRSERLGYTTSAGRTVLLRPFSRFGSVAYPVAPGPNGDLWLVEQRAPDPQSNMVLVLVTPTGRILARESGIYAASQTAGSGPGGTLWFATPENLRHPVSNLTEVQDTSDHRAQCLVPAIVGDPAGATMSGVRLRSHLAAVGCSDRLTPRLTGSAARPELVVSERPKPGTVIAAGKRIQLTVIPATEQYGRCLAPAGTVEVERTRTSVVFAGHGGRQFYGCLLQRGQVRHLFTDSDDVSSSSTAEQLITNGAYVAFEVVHFGHYAPYYSYAIRKIDLASGASLNVTAAMIEPNGPAWTNPTGGIELALSHDGFLAWTTDQFALVEPHAPLPAGELVAHDSTGQHILDTAEPLDLTNLRFAGNTLSWTHNGSSRTALLN
jgi:streptogramin lyase